VLKPVHILRGRGEPSAKWLWSGSFLYLLLFGLAWLSGARLDFDRPRILQFIGSEELQQASWSELLNIHSQPLGFNAVLKFTDQFGVNSEVILVIGLVTMAFLGVWMTADIACRLTGSTRWGVVAGLLAGALPGTTYYSLWVFYTLPVAFLLTATVWGMVRAARTGSIAALTLSIMAIVLAALFRSSIVWLFVIAWIALNIPTIRRVLRNATVPRRLIALVIAGLALLGLGSLQANAFSSFGSITLSSWGAENSAKALQTTMSDGEIQELVGDDTCLSQVLETGVFRPIDEYPPCSRETDDSVSGASPLLTQYFWANGAANMNHRERLALSEQWLTFSARAIADDPTRVLRIPLPSLENEERGTVIRFLWPASWYWLIDGNVNKGGIAATVWIVAFAWVPIAMLLLILIGLVRARHLWSSDAVGRRLFRVATTPVLVLTVLYLFLETGENERFRVEMDWLLVALGISVLGRLWWSRTQASGDLGATPRENGPDGSEADGISARARST